MALEIEPNWVQKTLDKFVVQKNVDTRPKLGRNTQAELNKLNSIIDVVTKNQIPEAEVIRLQQKARDLLNILTAM